MKQATVFKHKRTNKRMNERMNKRTNKAKGTFELLDDGTAVTKGGKRVHTEVSSAVLNLCRKSSGLNYGGPTPLWNNDLVPVKHNTESDLTKNKNYFIFIKSCEAPHNFVEKFNSTAPRMTPHLQ